MKPSFLAAALLVALPATAFAQQNQLDNFQFRFGGFFPSIDTTVSASGANGLIGTTINMESTLGLSDSKTLPIFDATWRFAPRHRLAFEYVSLDRSASATLSAQIIAHSSFTTGTDGWQVGDLYLPLWIGNPADFVWNGQKVANVGIRSRGRGSRNAHKPGLKVDFDRYATGQKFLGLKSLVLDNLAQDPSGIHETVSMAFYARLGIPTPREAHVRLYVRGEYIGLYALIESVDKDFLKRVFGHQDPPTRTVATVRRVQQAKGSAPIFPSQNGDRPTSVRHSICAYPF